MLALVVDDNIGARAVGIEMVRELHLLAAEADDGKQAAGFCSVQMPDIILVDISMPNIDGIECIKKIRTMEHGNHPYIIANSAHKNLHAEEMIAAGANHFLPKPFSLNDLSQVLQQAKRLPSADAPAEPNDHQPISSK